MTKWTNEQIDAINKKDSNIIVSAGAGSGKTAVLSERVIRILKEKVHINELLILTFTKLAAHEMKERIRNKIKKEKDLINELDLIDSAYITTFDSFSLSLVKKYHYILNIDKNVNIVDSTIIDIEKSKILDAILEEYYKEKDSGFIKLIKDFCVKDDSEIKNAILGISKSLDLKIDKQEFIHNYVENFYNELKIEQDIKKYLELIHKKINIISLLTDEIKIEAEGEYYEKISNELSNLLESMTYEEIKNNVDIKLPSVPKNSEENLKQIKEKITSTIKEIKNLTRFDNEEEIKNTIIMTKEYATIILEIIEKLDNKLKEFKNQKNLYEFNDIALLAIKLVKENKEIKEEIKTSFKEILLDEYQDTNDIQETFINEISNNNVYMVGDIKQSIYRFRNANPSIFKNKYDNYSNKNGGIKIDLNKNFRSRKEVIENINQIFDLIMSDEIGGANYKKEHNMIFGNNTYIENKTLDNDLEILDYDYTKETTYKKEEIEAFIIAYDIKNKINNNYQVLDKETNKLRNITYNDFVILIDRSKNFDLYKKIFTYLNIPLSQNKDLNMNDDIDILIIKNILKLIKKINDKEIDQEFKYSFISIERSFLINEDDNEIFKYFLNNNYNESKLYKICEQIKENIENSSLSEIIEEILDKFNYLEKIISTSNINASRIRIDKIREITKSLEQMGYGLDDLINYLIELTENNKEIKYTLKENIEDSVKIMTIHKSKGLEYPICYYAGLYSPFNIKDITTKFSYNNKYGLILPYFKEGIGKTIYKDLEKEEYIKEEISEKIRLFYVALTRAREKMIIVEPKTEGNIDITNYEYRSFKDILDSIKVKIIKYYKEIKIENINIDKNYEIPKNIDIYSLIPTNSKKIEEKIIKNDKQKLKENTYSKTKHSLITKEEKETMNYGKKIHEIFELNSFENKENIYINKLLEHSIFKNIKDANIIKEYEFIYQNEDIEYHGIIDLMLEYEEYIDIIDYKLKNIIDDAYINQLHGYKEYIEKITNKKVNLYLYSIIENKIKKII